MKNLLIVLSLLVSSFIYGQSSEHEIFYMCIEQRDSSNQDFPPQEYQQVVGIFAFELDSLAILSAKGDFSRWVKKDWLVIGETSQNMDGPFKQLVIPVVDVREREVAMISFIVGPFEFTKELYIPTDGLIFEATILYRNKRYTFLGIY